MSVRSLFLSAAIILALVHPLQAQNVSLAEAPLDNACFRLELTLDLRGKVSVFQEGKLVSFDHQAKAKHEFVERILTAAGGVAQKTARYYHTAEATVVADKDAAKKTLRPERRLLAVQRHKDVTAAFSPKGALTQDELELTEHFDTLHLSGLLPGKDVAVGATWRLDAGIAQALCDFDGLIEHDLTGKLDKVEGDRAHLTVIGKAKGIDLGAEVNLLVEARGQFDLKEKRLVALTWKQTDERQQGPVNPKLSADVTIQLTRTPIEEPTELSNFALVPFPNDPVPPADMLAIVHQDAQKRLRFKHSREWHLVGVRDDQVVLRLMERGDFVAQATVTRLKKAEAMMPLKDFEALMADAPGWDHEQVVEKTDKIDAPFGHKVYRIMAQGEQEKVKALQIFYLVHSPKGDQALIAFTMTPNQVQRLESRDLVLIRSLILPGSDAPASARED